MLTHISQGGRDLTAQAGLIPDESAFGRILRTFTQKNINERESLNHRIRAGIWRKALRSGKSNVGVLPRLEIEEWCEFNSQAKKSS